MLERRGFSDAVDGDRHSRNLCHLALADTGEESGFPMKNSKWGSLNVDTNNQTGGRLP